MTSQDEKYIYFYKHDKCPALLLGYYNKKTKGQTWIADESLLPSNPLKREQGFCGSCCNWSPHLAHQKVLPHGPPTLQDTKENRLRTAAA